jgi:hypothetical protein
MEELQENRRVRKGGRQGVVGRASQKGLPRIWCVKANDDAKNLNPGPECMMNKAFMNCLIRVASR